MSRKQPASQRCTATSKQSGEQCKRWAIPGGTVCRIHGGRAGQVQRAAKRRLLAAEATEQLARLGISIETTPIEALEAMLWEAAGNVVVLRQLVYDLARHQLYRELVHDNEVATGEAKPHIWVVLYNQERDRLAKLAEACAKLGLDERRVRLAEVHVERFLEAVTGAITDVGLTGEQTARFKQALAQRLRSAA